ncbi:MAG TPA: Ig-like domain-containing protein [Kofleriaceae bacterium]|jgi:hypothetical protein
MRQIHSVVLICLAVVSCYRVPEPDCGFICGAGNSCPDDYTCGSDTICHRIGALASTVCVRNDGGLDAPILSPMVVSEVPSDGASGVSRTAPITATANQSLIASTVTTSSFLVLTSAGVQLPGVVDYDDSTLTMTFTPAGELPAGATLSATVTATITSAMTAPLMPLTWMFTTIDDQPPMLASSSPLANAVNVPVSSTIVVAFSEPVTGVNGTSFTVTAGAPIAGVVSGSGASYSFAPSLVLPAASVVTVSLSGSITDLAGNSLLPVQFMFTTQ